MEITKERELEHLRAQENMSQIKVYYYWALSHLESVKNGVGSCVWDASAGVGIIAEYLRNKTDQLILTEYSEENLRILKDKFNGQVAVTVSFCDLSRPDESIFAQKSVDTIINLDVLEHIEDDLAVMRTFYKALVPGGHLLVKCPAHPQLFCGIDEASLHYRRYSKSEMKMKLEAAGFVVKKIRYMNAPGALLYFFKGKIKKKSTNFSNTMSEGGLSIIAKSIPIIQKIESFVRFPVGLSVIAVAEKPAR